MKEILELYAVFAKIGMFTIGGGYAMLPLLEQEICVKRNWSTNDEIMDYFAIGQCTPGIIAINTSTFVGYRRKGILGGIVATLGFVTPSIIIISIIASFISNFSNTPIIQHALAGIRIAVCVLLVRSIAKLVKNGVKEPFQYLIFISVILLSFFKIISTIIIIILCAIISIIYNIWKEKQV